MIRQRKTARRQLISTLFALQLIGCGSVTAVEEDADPDRDADSPDQDAQPNRDEDANPDCDSSGGANFCDPAAVIDVISSPAGGAFSPGDVEIDAAIASGVDGTLECRFGKVAQDGTIDGAFALCSAAPFTPPHDLQDTGDGLYRTELRARRDDGATSPALAIDYYLHASLVGAPKCDLGVSEAVLFARAEQRLPTDYEDEILRFDPDAEPGDIGFAHLANPFIRVQFSPRFNRFFAFGTTEGRFDYSDYVRTDGRLAVLSLRRRFALNSDATMIAAYRRYASRRAGSETGAEICSMATISVGTGFSARCDAVVLNREGAGVCLTVKDGEVTFARAPNETLFGRLASSLLPPDEPLTNQVDNAMWRKLGREYSPGGVNPGIDRSSCGQTANQVQCSSLGASRRWGWQEFSPKCYGEPSCVDVLEARELKRFSGEGFDALFLPDHELFDFQ